MNGTDHLCGLCQAEPAGDILKRPAGEVAEEGDHGGKERQCKKCVQRRGKAAHALAAASFVIALERFDRLVRQLGRTGSDELALAAVRAVFNIVGDASSALADHMYTLLFHNAMVIIADNLSPVNAKNGTVLRRPERSGRGPACGCRGRHTSPAAGASRSRRCGRRARRACCTRCPV